MDDVKKAALEAALDKLNHLQETRGIDYPVLRSQLKKLSDTALDEFVKLVTFFDTRLK